MTTSAASPDETDALLEWFVRHMSCRPAAIPADPRPPGMFAAASLLASPARL